MPQIATGFRRPWDGSLTLTQDRGVPLGPNNEGIDPSLIHLGEDWAGARGTSILAMGNGRVVLAQSTTPFGNTVIIEHTMSDGRVVYSLYGHLDRITVSIGDVTIGQKIGELGDTGPGGLHLHWEVSYVNSFLQSGIYGRGYDTPAQYLTSSQLTVDPSDFVRNHPVTVTAPDLAIQSASVDDLTVSVGQRVTVDWDVANLGSGAAGASYAGVYLSRDATWDASDIKVGGESTSSLSGGGRDTGEDATFTVSSSISAGTWHVLVVADDGRIVGESNEANNVWSQRITVSNSTTTRPDLVIDNVRIDDTTVRAGQSVKVSWDARNIGNAEAGGTDQFIFASRDRTLSSSDIYLDRESLGTMSVGERDGEYESFAMANLSRGRWYIGVVADAGLDVVESNESNNISWVAFDII